MQYTQDNDELVVPYTSNGGSAGIAHHWPNALMPYLKSTQILLCPSNRAGVNMSYTANGYMMTSGASPRALASIPLPAQSPL